MTEKTGDTTLATGDSATEEYRRPSGDIEITVPGYRIQELLGTGGMGEVYKAQQEGSIRRQVALKVVKLGMDSQEVLARFESERQALALMNHANIALVYDGGMTEQGRPYFAMEFVQGEPITSYCDRHRLTVRERLDLFLQVCDGVRHAHQKGIIHRDLKPSNVMVTIQDDRPVPKIIDFGVAKAISQRLTEKTMFTTLGMMIGTPEYMSPEQAEMTGLDIDTRTDIYSLGVLLYELLVGSLPFETAALRSAGFEGIRRMIREDEPPRPSAKITRPSKRTIDVVKNRNTDFSGLARQIRGDLDWIILKALEKDRTRRYETANALNFDIRRHLENKPVRASPPSAVYRAGKFVRRHRGAVAAAALLTIALVVGIVGTTTGLVRARKAERRASQEAETARQVSDFLVELFRVSDPNEAQGETITVREVLDDGAQRITSELREQPITQARLMGTIGTVYRQLGLYEEAAPLLEKSLETREELLDGESLEVAESLYDLGELYQRQGEYEKAQELSQRALQIRESRLGPNDPLVAENLAGLAWALVRQSRNDEAGPLFERALEIREAALEPADPELADSQVDLGVFYWRQGDFEAAEPLLTEALATYEEVLGPNDYRIRSALNDLAVLYWTQGRLEEAEGLYLRAIEIKERILGPDHPEVASSLNNLALIYDGQAKYEQAEPLMRRALGIYEASLGAEHDKTAMMLGNLAWIDYRLGNFNEAESLYVRALDVYERTVGPEHTNVGILLRDHARLAVAQRHWSSAEQRLVRTAAIYEKTLGPDHPDLAECLDALADVQVEQGRLETAESHYRRALEIRRARYEPDNSLVQETQTALADLLVQSGRSGEAERILGAGGSS